MLARPDYKIHFGYSEMGAGKIYDFVRGIKHEKIYSLTTNQVYDRFVNSGSSAGGSIYLTDSYTYHLDIKFWNIMPSIFSIATYSVFGNLSRFRVNYTIPEEKAGVDKFQESNGTFSVSAALFQTLIFSKHTFAQANIKTSNHISIIPAQVKLVIRKLSSVE